MARESVWQRRARKCRSAKADYYPKVNLNETTDETEEVLLAEGNGEPVAPPPAAAPPAAPARPPAAAEPQRTAAAPPTIEEKAPAPPESLDFVEAPLPEAPAPQSDAPSVLPLPEYLELSAATPLARALLERRGAPIVLDASSVQRLGAQCIQVLLSAKRTWSEDRLPLTIVNCAPRMIEDLQTLGIDPTTLTNGELRQ